MSSLLGVWEALWGLLVEDGSLAVGIVVALAITWIAASVLGDGGDRVGWLLLTMLIVLILTNLQLTGRKARPRGDPRL